MADNHKKMQDAASPAQHMHGCGAPGLSVHNRRTFTKEPMARAGHPQQKVLNPEIIQTGERVKGYEERSMGGVLDSTREIHGHALHCRKCQQDDLESM